jgi:hypothetical protein
VHERHEILLVLRSKLQLEDDLEELNGILQRQQTPSCKYGGLSLMPRSMKVLIDPSPGDCDSSWPNAVKPVEQALRFLLSGEGETGIMAYTILLRYR